MLLISKMKIYLFMVSINVKLDAKATTVTFGFREFGQLLATRVIFQN